MLKPVRSSQFKKDIKRITRSGAKDMSELKTVLETLIDEKPLAKRYKNHPLKASWKGFFECHIKPDWLLIYKIDKIAKELQLARTGSHSELF